MLCYRLEWELLHSSLSKILLFVIHEMDELVLFFLWHSFDSHSNTAYRAEIAVIGLSNWSIIDHAAKGLVDLGLLLPLRVVLSNMSLHGAFKATSLLSMLLFFSFCVCLSYCINIHCIGSKGGTRCGFTPPPFFPLFQGKALPCVWFVCFGEGLFPSFLHSVWLRIQVHWFFCVALAQESKSFGKSW